MNGNDTTTEGRTMKAETIEGMARRAEEAGRYTRAVQLYRWAQDEARPLSATWTRCRESAHRLGG